MIRVFAKRDLAVMDIIELQGRIVITPEALTNARAAKEQRRAARRQRVRETTDKKDSILASSAHDAVSSSSSCVATAAVAAQSLPPLTSSTFPSTSPPSSASSAFSDEEEDDGNDDSDGGVSAQHDARRTAAVKAADVTVEVPLGHVEQNHLNEKRCTLCIDTLRVDGSRGTYKHPLLVLKACSPQRMRHLRRRLASSSSALRGAKEQSKERGAESIASATAADTSVPTMLFSEWLQQHSDALSLDSLFLDDMVTEQGTQHDDDALAPGSLAVAGCAVPASCKRQREDEGCGEGESCSSVEHPNPNTIPASSTSSPNASTSMYKDYELVGVVRGSVLFNSKPARVFQ